MWQLLNLGEGLPLLDFGRGNKHTQKLNKKMKRQYLTVIYTVMEIEKR